MLGYNVLGSVSPKTRWVKTFCAEGILLCAHCIYSSMDKNVLTRQCAVAKCHRGRCEPVTFPSDLRSLDSSSSSLLFHFIDFALSRKWCGC